MLQSHPAWVQQRVRHFVLPLELLPRIARVVYEFGALRCAKTNQTLFNDKEWEITPNVLENIRRGYYSNPPGVQLYYFIGKDKYGLSMYKCCCSTNVIEG